MPDYARPYDALIAGEPEAALALYEKRRTAMLGQPNQMHNWARLLCGVGRRSEAEFLFEPLSQTEDHAMFVAGQRLIERLEAGLSPAHALQETPLGLAETHREAIAAAMAEFDIARPPAASRHIAICGVSFCGSTLMDLLLEGLPGVASIGESVWLTLNWVGGGPGPRNFSEPRGKGVQQCNYCGHECEFLTPHFRTALGLNPIDWYPRIAEQLRTKVLVSADKNLPKIVLYEPLLRLEALIVFKSPKQAWASNYTKMAKDLGDQAYFDALVKYMTVWKEAYSDLTHNFKPQGRKVFLDFDRFADAPEDGFRSLARRLDLEYDPTALTSPSPGHSLGGNSNALRKVKTAGHRPDVRPLGEPAIPADHAAWIDSQEHLTALHAAMRERSEEVPAAQAPTRASALNPRTWLRALRT